MDETEIKHVLEAALLAAGRPLSLERLTELFTSKGEPPDRATLKRALDALASDYSGRGIELKEIATGYRVQVKRNMGDWLQPLWEERAPRYTRALLETLALVAYRQPITRAEIEEVRGVVVSTNIVRTLLERNWIRVVGHRDVPGKPAMFGTTKEFLDYFGLKKLEDLPTLAEIKELPELSPQTDLLESLEAEVRGFGTAPLGAEADTEAAVTPGSVETMLGDGEHDAEDETELAGADLFGADSEKNAAANDGRGSADQGPSESAEIIPLRASDDP
jgi:segregation and condensation protein B